MIDEYFCMLHIQIIRMSKCKIEILDKTVDLVVILVSSHGFILHTYLLRHLSLTR
jgi:hypothetical protein